MRQLCLTSGGRAFALLGNHEEMLLSGNYKNWLNNEEQSGFFDSKNNPGSVRLRHEYLGIKEDKIEPFRQSIFFSYCAHFAHLLLTQEYVIRSILDRESGARYAKLTQDALDLSKISSEKLKQIASDRSWATLEFCQKWLQNVWKSEKEMHIPGAIVVFSMGEVLGLHASVNAAKKFIESKRGEDFITPYSTTNGAKIRLHMYKRMPGSKSPDADLLWERDNKAWTSDKASQKMVDTVRAIKQRLPHITSLVQGHEPLSGKDMQVKTHRVPTPFGEVKITNLDIGMTPVYLPSKMDDKYSHNRVPNGLRIPTFGRDPLRLDADYSCSSGLKIRPTYESRTPTSIVILESKSNKPVAELSRNDKGLMSLKSVQSNVKLQVKQGNNYASGKQVSFEATKPASAGLYRVEKGWIVSEKVTPIGSLTFKQASAIRPEEDPVLLNAKREEEKARKAEEARKAAAAKKAKEEEEARKATCGKEGQGRGRSTKGTGKEGQGRGRSTKGTAAKKAKEEEEARKAAAEKKPRNDDSNSTEKKSETDEENRVDAKDVSVDSIQGQNHKQVPPQEEQEKKVVGSHKKDPPKKQPPQEPMTATLKEPGITIFVDEIGNKHLNSILLILRNVDNGNTRFVLFGEKHPKFEDDYPQTTDFIRDSKKFRKNISTSPTIRLHLSNLKPLQLENYHHLDLNIAKKRKRKKIEFEKSLRELINKLEGLD